MTWKSSLFWIVDLPSESEEVSDDIVDLLGCKLKISFMRRENWFSVENILAAIERIPPPSVDEYKLWSLTPTTIHFVELKLFSVW
jgi:hypothetical protein